MIRPELYKIRHHRTPWVLAVALAALTLAVPAWLTLRPPTGSGSYLVPMISVYTVVATMLATVFGAWLVGHEYRQGTMRRVVALDARRTRLLVAKAAVGTVALVAALAVVAAVGVAASWAAAAFHDTALDHDGAIRLFLSAGFTALVSAAIAYLASIILRNDTYAILTTLAMMVVLGPLLTLVPTLGDYTPYALTADLAAAIANTEPGNLATSTAAPLLASLIAMTAAAARTLFVHRDL